jgi:hypothetical protein
MKLTGISQERRKNGAKVGTFELMRLLRIFNKNNPAKFAQNETIIYNSYDMLNKFSWLFTD